MNTRARTLSSPHSLQALAVAAVLAVASGCTGGGTHSTPDDAVHGDDGGNGGRPRDGGGTDVTAGEFVAAGVVVDTQGKPLPNVEVVVDNQLLDDANATGRTGSDGRYRIELPPVAATWAVSATHSVDYHGRTYSFPLHPDDDSAFAGNQGGVRNFEWKLSGKRPDDGFYGAFVVGYTEPGDYSFDVRDVELTLVPDGPLVDGSTGRTVTGKFVATGDGDAVQDIPLGRYTLSAMLDGAPLGIRIRNSDAAYEASITSDFDAPYGSLSIYNIEVELKQP